jgi:hypothetical protein
MENLVSLLKNNIISQAKYYLEEADEFYPFGAVLNKDKKLSPVGIFFGEDHPTSLDVFMRLEKIILDGIKSSDYLIGGIGIDVYLDKTKPALEIRIYDGMKIENYFFLYDKKNDGYIFEEYFFVPNNN